MTLRTNKEITVIGAAVMDVLAGAVTQEVFNIGSMPMDFIRTSYGGDALNQSVVLSRLGKKTELITRLGTDDAGSQTKAFLTDNGVAISNATLSDEYPSSVNIVLVDDKGERYFFTNPKSCLRKLSKDDILPHVGNMAEIVSFASIFVSSELDIISMESVFRTIKTSGIIVKSNFAEQEDLLVYRDERLDNRDNNHQLVKNAEIKKSTGYKNECQNRKILITDMTKPKKGEKLGDIACFLPYIDYFLANEDEIAMLTDSKNPLANAAKVVEAGAGCAVIKRGSKGCIIKTASDCYEIPAYPDCKIIDSTGAGDSFAAGFIYGLSEGFSLEDCGRFGCAVASCIVEDVGGSSGIKDISKPMKRYREMKGLL